MPRGGCSASSASTRFYDIVHLLSGLAGAWIAWQGRSIVSSSECVYDLDAVVGMTMSRGVLDLSVFSQGPGAPDFSLTNWALNLPHIVLASLALWIGFRRPGEAAVAPRAATE